MEDIKEKYFKEMSIDVAAKEVFKLIEDNTYKKDYHFSSRHDYNNTFVSTFMGENGKIREFAVNLAASSYIETGNYRGYYRVYTIKDMWSTEVTSIVVKEYDREDGYIICEYKFMDGEKIIKELEATDERLEKLFKNE